MSKHICFVAPYIWPTLSGDRVIRSVGGAEMRQAILARALVRAGFRVSVITLDFGQPEGVEVDGVTILRAHKPNGGLPVLRFFHPRLTSWWRAMKRANADIYLQSTAAYLTAVVGAFCRSQGRCFIYSGASNPDFQRDQLWKKFRRRSRWRDQPMYLWGLERADAIVAQHAGQVEACRRWYGREAVEIANCYAPPAGAKASSDGVVLWVATMRALKRPELFLELARALPRQRFRMVGGPARGNEAEVFELMRQVAAGLPNVEFVGFVPFVEVEAHFNDARLFVNTSEYEGFPNTFLQSWARGIPTVSFVDCGAREGDRPVGYVCRDIAEMKEVVSRLCEDDVLSAQEGDRARRHFLAHHTVDTVVARYSRLIDQLVGSGRHD